MLVWAKNGFEQNVVLRKAPPLPEAFGLSSGSCRLQMWSAMDQCPALLEQQSVLLPSGLTDHILTFQSAWFPVGCAFTMGNSNVPRLGQAAAIRAVNPSDPGVIPTAKSLVTIGIQTVLVEEAKFTDLQSSLSGLSQATTPAKTDGAVEWAARAQFLALPSHLADRSRELQVASAPYAARGLVLDYVQLSGSTNAYQFTFYGTNTYVISNSFTVLSASTAAFQSGACIKLAYNASYLMLEGPASFPTSGAQVVLTSVDDNAYGAVIPGSTGSPQYAGDPALSMYFQTVHTAVSNALVRWSQIGIGYSESSGQNNQPTIASSVFQDCSVGLNVYVPGDTLSLVNVTNCDVQTPVNRAAGSVSGSMTANCGMPTSEAASPVDVTKLSGIEGEPAVTVNPANPQNVFVIANGPTATNGVIGMTSTNWGTSWNIYTFTNSLATNCWAWCDPSAAFDRFGNLFAVFIFRTNQYNLGWFDMSVALSTNGGFSFTTLTNFYDPTGLFDQPTITTGPGGSIAASSVWLTAYNGAAGDVLACGAAVTNLGQVGAFGSFVHINGSQGAAGLGDVAIGPAGEVAIVFQGPGARNEGPTPVVMSVNPYGLAQYTSFAKAWTNVISNVGDSEFPPACPNRGCDVEPGLAWDRTGGPYSGRLYMVYTDQPLTATNNLNTFVMYSTNKGTGWSAPLQVNSTNIATHFDPRIAVDQTSGKVAISWYDCRDDPNNVKTKFYAAVSSDGGAHWTETGPLESGQSCATNSSGGMDYYDYTGLAFYGGYFYPAWADNSNNPAVNPDGTSGMDVFVAKVKY